MSALEFMKNGFYILLGTICIAGTVLIVYSVVIGIIRSIKKKRKLVK